ETVFPPEGGLAPGADDDDVGPFLLETHQRDPELQVLESLLDEIGDSLATESHGGSPVPLGYRGRRRVARAGGAGNRRSGGRFGRFGPRSWCRAARCRRRHFPSRGPSSYVLPHAGQGRGAARRPAVPVGAKERRRRAMPIYEYVCRG